MFMQSIVDCTTALTRPSLMNQRKARRDVRSVRYYASIQIPATRRRPSGKFVNVCIDIAYMKHKNRQFFI